MDQQDRIPLELLLLYLSEHHQDIAPTTAQFPPVCNNPFNFAFFADLSENSISGYYTLMNNYTQAIYESGKKRAYFSGFLTHEGLAYSASMSKENKAYKLGYPFIERNRHENE